MDQLLQMIQSADPTDNESDACELLQLEGRAQGHFLAVHTIYMDFLFNIVFRSESLILFFLFRCLQPNGSTH